MRRVPPELRRLLVVAAVVAVAVAVVRLVEGHPAAARRNSRAPDVAVPGAGQTPVTMTPLGDGTVRVEHVQGVTIIPERPQRVASLGWNDELLAAGVRPAAATGSGGRGWPPHLAAQLDGVPLVDVTAGGPDLEALADAEPDLIIAVWYWQTRYDHLSAIAPTVVLQPGHWFWRERFMDVARLSGHAEPGRAKLAALEERIAATRALIHGRIGDESVAMLRIFAREYRLYGHGYSGPLLYGDLGLARPQLVDALAWEQDAARLSLEGLVALDADHILLMHEQRIPISGAELRRLTAHPIWQRLPAVRAGRVYPVADLLMRGGVISREVTLDRLDAIFGAIPMASPDGSE